MKCGARSCDACANGERIAGLSGVDIPTGDVFGVSCTVPPIYVFNRVERGAGWQATSSPRSSRPSSAALGLPGSCIASGVCNQAAAWGEPAGRNARSSRGHELRPRRSIGATQPQGLQTRAAGRDHHRQYRPAVRCGRSTRRLIVRWITAGETSSEFAHCSRHAPVAARMRAIQQHRQ